MAASFADESSTTAGLAAEAAGLRERAGVLADADVAAYTEFVRARRAGTATPDLAATLDAALDEAVRVPLEIARIGAEVAAAARTLADEGNPRLRGDAATGCWLAAAAASSAAVLVAENLASAPDDTRLAEARALAAAARQAAAGLPR